MAEPEDRGTARAVVRLRDLPGERRISGIAGRCRRFARSGGASDFAAARLGNPIYERDPVPDEGTVALLGGGAELCDIRVERVFDAAAGSTGDDRARASGK